MNVQFLISSKNREARNAGISNKQHKDSSSITAPLEIYIPLLLKYPGCGRANRQLGNKNPHLFD